MQLRFLSEPSQHKKRSTGADDGMAVLYLTNNFFTEGNLCRACGEYVLSSRYCKHSIFVEFVCGVAISFFIGNAKHRRYLHPWTDLLQLLNRAVFQFRQQF